MILIWIINFICLICLFNSFFIHFLKILNSLLSHILYLNFCQHSHILLLKIFFIKNLICLIAIAFFLLWRILISRSDSSIFTSIFFGERFIFPFLKWIWNKWRRNWVSKLMIRGWGLLTLNFATSYWFWRIWSLYSNVNILCWWRAWNLFWVLIYRGSYWFVLTESLLICVFLSIFLSNLYSFLMVYLSLFNIFNTFRIFWNFCLLRCFTNFIFFTLSFKSNWYCLKLVFFRNIFWCSTTH